MNDLSPIFDLTDSRSESASDRESPDIHDYQNGSQTTMILYDDGETHIVSSKGEALDVLCDGRDTKLVERGITPEHLTAMTSIDRAYSDCSEDVQENLLYEVLSEHVDTKSIAREHVLSEREACDRDDIPYGTVDPTASTDYKYEVTDAIGAIVDHEAFAAADCAHIGDAVQDQFIEDCRSRIHDLWSDGYGAGIEYEGNRIPREVADEQFEDEDGEGLAELFG
jgi:hypothetical protein